MDSQSATPGPALYLPSPSSLAREQSLIPEGQRCGHRSHTVECGPSWCVHRQRSGAASGLSGADRGSGSPLCAPGHPVSVASYPPASLHLPFYPRDAEVRTWYGAVTSDCVVEGPGIPSAPPHQPPDPPVPESPESRLFSGAGPIRHSL